MSRSFHCKNKQSTLIHFTLKPIREREREKADTVKTQHIMKEERSSKRKKKEGRHYYS
jgi:hypothetical protein